MKSFYASQADESGFKQYSESVPDAVKSVIALVLTVMDKRGRSEKYIRELYSEIKAYMGTSKIAGMEIRDDDVKEYIFNKYGIDFEDMPVNVESVSMFRKRARNGNRK